VSNSHFAKYKTNLFPFSSPYYPIPLYTRKKEMYYDINIRKKIIKKGKEKGKKRCRGVSRLKIDLKPPLLDE